MDIKTSHCCLLLLTVTSSEVKKRLHEFVISKKQRDLALASLSGAEAFKHWLVVNVAANVCVCGKQKTLC